MSKKGSQAQRTQGMVNRAQGKLFEELIDAALAYGGGLQLDRKAEIDNNIPNRQLRKAGENRVRG